jgi:polysaccharide pyruvyl transferase WcaK-like protein
MLPDIDQLMVLTARSIVKLSKYCRFDTWQAGKKLRILLIGYNGKGNAGADARVIAMVNQFSHILGQENIEVGILTLDGNHIKGNLPPVVKTEPFTPMSFWSILKACNSYHMGVLAEGSCLKSKFSNALTTLFIGCAGSMKRQGKPCIAYGSEAGEMDHFIYRAAQQFCDKTYFIARTRASLEIIRDMGFTGGLGTDTAWLAPSAPREWAQNELATKAGWDGKKPLVGVAVINPFWWPVKVNLGKYLSGESKTNPQYHYSGWHFFSDSPERRSLFHQYLSGIARAVDSVAERRQAQIVIFGMDALDQDACVRLQKMLRTCAHIFSSIDYNSCQLTALLRNQTMLITSRYHARVLSMLAGIPSIAISMDERLYNLLAENSQVEDYYFEAADPQLAEKLRAAMEKMWDNQDQVSAQILETIPYYLKILANMGASFRDFINKEFPLFPLPPKPQNWLGYLPPLNPELKAIVELETTVSDFVPFV